MPFPKLQKYYAIIRKSRTHQHEILVIEGTAIDRVRRKLKNEGLLVLYVLSYKTLKKLNETPVSDWSNLYYNWPSDVVNLIKNIDINMLETDIIL